MADPVPLDPGSYAGTYKLIGGSPALDFANLVSYRGTPRAHDWLNPATNLHRWLDATQLDVQVTTGIDELFQLRESLAQVFLDVIDGRDPTASALDQIAVLSQRARGRHQLVWDRPHNSATWSLPQPTLNEVLALDAADLLTDAAKRHRLGACAECRWVYLDTTRNRSRRWCDPADCGNRARQRRHYQQG